MLKQILRNIVKPISPCLFARFFGKNAGKDFVVCLSFDIDYPKDVESLPAVLDLLDKYKLKASFACVGKWVEKHPAEHKMLVQRGHEIINHTYTHPDNELLSPDRFFNKMSFYEQKQEAELCDSVCKKILRVSPVGFRTPHFGRLHCENVYKILSQLGYKYSSSTILTATKHNGKPFLAESNILEIPMMSCPDHYFPVFDSWHCYRSPNPAHNKEGELIRLFTAAVNLCKKHSVPCVLYFDPQDVASHINEFKSCLDLIKNKNIHTKTCCELLQMQLL